MRELPIPVHDFPGDTGAPTIVGIHDFTATGLWFGPLAEELDGRFHLLAPDLRGRGDAHAHPPATSLQTHVDDVSALLDSLGRRCILVGHGTGAVTAWMTALDRPGVVDALVLLDGPTEPPESGVDDWLVAAATLDPGVERLRGTYPHRDRLIAQGVEEGRLPSSGLSRAMRRAVDAEVAGFGFAWRPRLGATALQADWRALTVWRPAGPPDVPTVGLAARHGHRVDDPPLDTIRRPEVEWRVVDTTHAGLLWDPTALTVVAATLAGLVTA